jgi:polyferredoxin
MLFVGAATQSATVSAVSRLYLGGQTSVAEAYAAVMTRIPFIVLMMIVLGLATAVGFVFCIAPAVILSLLWCLAIPVAILEHKGIIASASRSFELTSGWRLRVLVIYILYFVLIYIVSFITQLPVLAIGFIAALSSGGDASAIPTWTIVASTIGTFVSSCLATPLLTVALSLVYYNQRVQKEAFDLQHMMTLLDDAAPRTAL